MTITIAEILAELEAASRTSDQPDGYLTIAELVALTGWSDGKVRKALIAAKAAGRLDMVRVVRETLAGAMQPVPAYRVQPVVSAKASRTGTKKASRKAA